MMREVSHHLHNQQMPPEPHMLCLSPQGRITDYIHGIHKPEMFQSMSSLGHLQGKELWIEEGHQGQKSCSPQIDKAEGHWDTKDNPAAGQPSPLLQGDPSLLDISQPG